MVAADTATAAMVEIILEAITLEVVVIIIIIITTTTTTMVIINLIIRPAATLAIILRVIKEILNKIIREGTYPLRIPQIRLVMQILVILTQILEMTLSIWEIIKKMEFITLINSLRRELKIHKLYRVRAAKWKIISCSLAMSFTKLLVNGFSRV